MRVAEDAQRNHRGDIRKTKYLELKCKGLSLEWNDFVVKIDSAAGTLAYIIIIESPSDMFKL